MVSGETDWREKAQQWRCNHFSIHNKDGDIAWLLGRLAAAITQLGDVVVLDVVINFERDEHSNAVRGTVYFSFENESSSSHT